MNKNFKGITLIRTEKINFLWKEKEARSGSNQIILIHSNVSNILKKQCTKTLYCFANRRSLDESSNSMDEKLFLKKIEVSRFVGGLFPLTTMEGQSKEWVNINRE